MKKNIRLIFKTIYLLLLFLSSSTLFAQYNKQLFSIYKDAPAESTAVLIKQLNSLDKSKFSKADNALFKITMSEYYLKSNKEDKALKELIEARKVYKALDSVYGYMETSLKIFEAIFYTNIETTDPYHYLTEYTKHAESKRDNRMLVKAYIKNGDYWQFSGKPEKSRTYYQKAELLAQRLKNEKALSTIYTNIALLYIERLHEPDSGLYYLEKDIPYLKNKGDVTDLNTSLTNRAAAYTIKKDYKTAIRLFSEAYNLPTEKYEYGYKQANSESLYKVYKMNGDYKNALKYQEIAYLYSDSMQQHERSIALRDIENRYRAKEKELENKVLKSDIKTNRIMLYTSIGLTVALAAIGSLALVNARRKEKLILQEKLIEQQKLEKALKDHELQSIDIMLQSQERERQRIANDLHDNLGSMLTTLKLNFENLKLRKGSEDATEIMLYERTDELIEEAYHKVRRLAHTKNAGVLTGDGLIPALDKLTNKISIPGKLELQFLHYGFEKRLDNTIEFAIFRMIQELATNIIKHSHATEATLQLTNHEDTINIIIEDNGVGFNPANIKPDGMGLDAITKKVAQLKGEITIDSTPGKGTTIIIDLPI